MNTMILWHEWRHEYVISVNQIYVITNRNVSDSKNHCSRPTIQHFDESNTYRNDVQDYDNDDKNKR